MSSSGFKFPPPPPPPPPTRPSPAANTQVSQSHASSRGRGGFSRGGAGGFSRGGRGRGSGFRGGQSRGGHQSHVQGQSSVVASSHHVLPFSPYDQPPNSLKRKADGPSPQTKKPHVETPPAVPSFGLPLPSFAPSQTLNAKVPVPPQQQQDTKATSASKRKRESNQLGLTPHGDAEDYSDDEDIDEEAAYANFDGKLQFEHRGKIVSLTNSGDLKNWIEERRKRWPTSAKIDARNALITKKKQERNEALQQALRQKLVDSQKRDDDKKREEDQKREDEKKRAADIATSTQQSASSRQERVRRRLAKMQARLAKLQKQMEQSSQGNDLDGDDRASPGSLTSNDSGASDSEFSSSDDSGSAGPEEETSKKTDGQIAAVADESAQPPGPDRKICRYFLQGRCKNGARCRWKHERPDRPKQQQQHGSGTAARGRASGSAAPAGRKTLYQRLVEQEQKAEDKLVLDAIKLLGSSGMLEAK